MNPVLPYKIVCLTPVRNEAWILPTFLAATSLWADVIIVADQGSTDGSAEIARQFPKVVLLANPASSYSEAARQQLLISAAREQPGRLILVALDADEFLSPELISAEWFARLAATGPGAHARVPFFNIKPDLLHGWAGHCNFIAGWVDNGREHVPEVIHSTRFPITKDDPVLVPAPGAAVMHWQFVAPARMRSKHRWYLAWERLNRPERSAVHTYRQYHHMNAVSRNEIRPVPPEWLAWYRARGVDLANIADDGQHWWDAEVLVWLDKHGAKYFAREAIWAFDWRAKAEVAGLAKPERFSDPRTRIQKLVHLWLRSTQSFHRWLPVRAVDKFLSKVF